jgi:hypothetical protein
MARGEHAQQTHTQRRATVVRALPAVLATVASFAALAAESPSSVAAGPSVKVPSVSTPAVGTPSISPVTITVPGKSPTPAPAPSPAPAPAPTAPAVTRPAAPTVASSTGVSSATASIRPTASAIRTAVRRPRTSAAQRRRSRILTERRLRSDVVRLSACVASLSPSGQRLLLLRAGIATGQPTNPAAAARRLGIGLAREGRTEHAALAALQTAARQDRCGTIPAWVHVPASDRLVALSPALSRPSQRVPTTHQSSSRSQLTAFRGVSATLAFVLSRAGGAVVSSSG